MLFLKLVANNKSLRRAGAAELMRSSNGGAMRHKTVLSPERQWDLTAALVARRWPAEEDYCLVRGRGDSPTLGELFLCQARVNHRLFLRGDVFVCDRGPGSERKQLCGVSSRGYILRDYYFGYARRCPSRHEELRGRFRTFPANRARIRLVELPDHLVGKHPVDPDVRSFVVDTLRAGASERG
jgi:hypothetical protein